MSENGRFIWYELETTDTDAAKAFYTKVVGWGTQDMPDGMEYTLFTVEPGRGAGGLMTLPDELRKMGVPPHWLGYVMVDNVDASTTKAKSLGADVNHGPEDITTVGRFSVIQDPQGGVVALFKPIPPPGGAPAPLEPGRVGTTGWHELYANDGAKAFDFYSALLGWKKFDTMDMGPMGLYHIFGIPGADMPMGGIMTKPAQVPMPYWTYYFHVGDIDAAAGRVKAASGQVLMGPMEVPGGDWIIQGLDPQGALFALVGKKG